MQHLPLNDLPSGVSAVVIALEPSQPGISSTAVMRLGELGFLPGERVRVLQRGPGGREPLAVQVGDAQFALRLVEARCIRVRLLSAGEVV
jgi:ferrous iron transport protein A